MKKIVSQQFRCGKCKRVFGGEMVMDAPIKLWVASVKVLRCPRGHADYHQLFLIPERTSPEAPQDALPENNEPQPPMVEPKEGPG